MKVLVIDSEEAIEDISVAMRIRWPQITLVATLRGEEAENLVKDENPDFIILGNQLSDMEGFDVLGQIRHFSDVPVIFLSTSRDEAEVVKALELGASEYIFWPIGQLELLSRVNAVLRTEGVAK